MFLARMVKRSVITWGPEGGEALQQCLDVLDILDSLVEQGNYSINQGNYAARAADARVRFPLQRQAIIYDFPALF